MNVIKLLIHGLLPVTINHFDIYGLESNYYQWKIRARRGEEIK